MPKFKFGYECTGCNNSEIITLSSDDSLEYVINKVNADHDALVKAKSNFESCILREIKLNLLPEE